VSCLFFLGLAQARRPSPFAQACPSPAGKPCQPTSPITNACEPTLITACLNKFLSLASFQGVFTTSLYVALLVFFLPNA